MNLTKKEVIEIIIMYDNGYKKTEIQKVMKLDNYVIDNVIKMYEYMKMRETYNIVNKKLKN